MEQNQKLKKKLNYFNNGSVAASKIFSLNRVQLTYVYTEILRKKKVVSETISNELFQLIIPYSSAQARYVNKFSISVMHRSR